MMLASPSETVAQNLYTKVYKTPPPPEGSSPNVIYNHRPETVNRTGFKRSDNDS